MDSSDSSDSRVGVILNPTPSNGSRGRKWVMTINNYTSDIYDSTLKELELSKRWIIGEEKGSSGTPHLQIYVEWNNQLTFMSMKKRFPTAHIEKAKGNEESNFLYCSKEGRYKTNIVPKTAKKTPEDNRKYIAELCLKPYENIEWKDWQAKVLSLVNGEPDPRKIHWYWEDRGNVGKSFLVKYLCITKDVIICDGKKNDIFNQVNECLSVGKIPKIILMDIPRTMEDRVAWGTLEQLKNGCLYSGKYEGGMCIFPNPHVICFANFEPDQNSMSSDRWDIVSLREREAPGSGDTPYDALPM